MPFFVLVFLFIPPIAAAFSGRIGVGEDPQFIPVYKEEVPLPKVMPSFSTQVRKILPCDGTINVWSFECDVMKTKGGKREKP